MITSASVAPLIALALLGAAVVVPQPAHSIARARIAGTRRGNSRGVGVLAAVFVVVFAFLLIGRLSIILAAGIVATTAGWFLRQTAERRRKKREEKALVAYLGAVAADLRAGASLPGALQRALDVFASGSGSGPGTRAGAGAAVASKAPPELRSRLQTAAIVAERGGSYARSMEGAGPQLTSFAALCTVGERHGIALAGLVEEQQKRLAERQRHRQATTASLQGPQTTALVLSCLPLAGLAMGTAMGAHPFQLLFGGGLGGLLLVVGAGLCCGGFAWAQSILRKAAG